MEKPLISVVIPTFNSQGFLKKCIDSIASQTINRNQFEIIIVDDGSNDNTVNLAKELGVDKVLEIKHAGPGAARNFGAKHARANLLAFIDSDCKAKRDWLELIQKELQHCDGITGPLFNGNNNIISWAEYLLEFSDFNENTPRSQINFAAGANQAYKKSDFLSLGGFLEDQIYSEDVQFGKSFEDSGKILTYVPELQIIHYGRSSFKPFLHNMKNFGKRSYNDSMIIISSYSKFNKSRWLMPVLFIFKLGARFKSAIKAKKIFMFFICLPFIITGTLMFTSGFFSKSSKKEKIKVLAVGSEPEIELIAKNQKVLENWPNFFIVGAPRAGTTSLFEHLKKIPGVYLPTIKEPQYFSPNCSKTDGLTRINNKEEYLSLFKDIKNEKAIGEASTSYLWDPESPALIHQSIPHAKIIIFLRDPIKRAYSHYLLHVRNNYEKQSFRDAIDQLIRNFEPGTSKRYLHGSLYSKQIRRYQNIFGMNQVKIIIFEEFIKDPKTIVNEIIEFLNLNYDLVDFTDSIHNKSNLPRGRIERIIFNSELVRRISKKIFSNNIRNFLKERVLLTDSKPPISNEVKEILHNYFSDDVSELEKILGRKLSWPNFND